MPSLKDIPEFPDPPVGYFWRVRPASTPGLAYLELHKIRPLFSKRIRSEIIIDSSLFGVEGEFVREANRILKSLNAKPKDVPADYAGDYYA